MRDPVIVCDGKYTFYMDEDGLLNCDRHGKPWPAFRDGGDHLQGCVLSMYHDLVAAQHSSRKPLSEKTRKQLRDGIEGLQVASDLIGASGLRPYRSRLISGPQNLAIVNDAHLALQSLGDLGYPELNNLAAQVCEFLGRVT